MIVVSGVLGFGALWAFVSDEIEVGLVGLLEALGSRSEVIDPRRRGLWGCGDVRRGREEKQKATSGSKEDEAPPKPPPSGLENER